jgi:hypothetical protein
MELTASPYGNEATRLNGSQLKDWYSRHGFVPEEGHDPALGYMTREPNTTMAAKPKATGYSQKADQRYPATTKGEPVGNAETAKSDNEHFANAKQELGEKASISDVAKRAQEMKDAAKPKASGGAPAPDFNKFHTTTMEKPGTKSPMKKM